MRPIMGPTPGGLLGQAFVPGKACGAVPSGTAFAVRRVIEMKSLIASAVVGLCAFAGAGLGISAVVSSSAVASTAVPAGPPVGPSGVVTVSQLAPGPANPGGPYPFVTTPCDPVSCS
jgi:hypothetical protein